jgi:hypothetical protein
LTDEFQARRDQLKNWRKEGEFRLGGYFGGGNLDVRGRVIHESQTRSLAARLWFEREVIGDTTDAIGLLKARPWVASTEPGRSQGRRRGEARFSTKAALKMPMLLSIPMRRDMRVETPDGRTSFHFAHDNITKGQHRDADVTADFARYMERDEAVAEVLVADAERHGMAAAHIGYIGRPGAVAQHLFRPAIFSNIPVQRRLDIWRSIEALEKEPGDDQLTIDYHRSPTFWDSLADDERCPAAVRDGIHAARASGTGKPRKIVTPGNELLRAIAMEHGWTPPTKDPATGKLVYSHGAQFHDAEGGRIQSRFTAEFPDGLDMEGRVTVLKAFCAYFDEKGLPYVAVIHQPSASNHHKNWHFHLAYYDRPCRLFTNRIKDHLGERSPTKKKQIDHDFLQRVRTLGTEALQPYAANLAYDFEVPVTYIRPDRHKATIRPFEQGKPSYLKHKTFIPSMRKRYSDLVNEELARVQARRRLSELPFDELGIAKAPDRHLGSNANRLERLGIPTIVGVDNERKQFDYLQVLRRKAYVAVLGAIKRSCTALMKRLPNAADGSHPSSVAESLRNDVRHATRTQLLVASHRQLADDLEAGIARARSRAEAVDITCEQRLLANWNESNPRQRAEIRLYIERQKEARAHLSGVQRFFRDDVERARECRKIADQLDAEARALQASISSKLAELEVDRRHQQTEQQLAALDEEAAARDAAVIEAAKNRRVGPALTSYNPEVSPAKEQPSFVAKTSSEKTDGPQARPQQPQAPEQSQDQSSKHSKEERPEPAQRVNLRMLMEAIDMLVAQGTHVQRKATPEAFTYHYADVALRGFKLTAEDLLAKPAQKRLMGIFSQQQKDYNRLAGFARKSPDRIGIIRHPYSNAAVLQSTDAPPDIAALVRKYAKSTVLQQLVRQAIAEGGAAQRQAAERIRHNGSQAPQAAVDIEESSAVPQPEEAEPSATRKTEGRSPTTPAEREISIVPRVNGSLRSDEDQCKNVSPAPGEAKRVDEPTTAGRSKQMAPTDAGGKISPASSQVEAPSAKLSAGRQLEPTRMSPEVEKAPQPASQPPLSEDLPASTVKHLQWLFLLAKTDEERRKAAVQIRRNKAALTAMNAHAHPLWTAEQMRYRNLQTGLQHSLSMGR